MQPARPNGRSPSPTITRRQQTAPEDRAGEIPLRDGDEARRVSGRECPRCHRATIPVEHSTGAGQERSGVPLGLPPGRWTPCSSVLLISPPHSAGNRRHSGGLCCAADRTLPSRAQAAAQCAQIGFAKADLFPAFALTGTSERSPRHRPEQPRQRLYREQLGVQRRPVQWSILNYGQVTPQPCASRMPVSGTPIAWPQNTVLVAAGRGEWYRDLRTLT